MKLSYKNQLILTCVLILGGNALNMWLHHWLFTSAARFLAGLLWVVHPVMFGPEPATKKQEWIIRCAGIYLMVLAVFGRMYLY